MVWIIALDSKQAIIFKANSYFPYLKFFKTIAANHTCAQPDDLFTFFRTNSSIIDEASSRTSWLQTQEKDFCKEIANTLNVCRESGEYQLLIIVAIPKLLNYLQQKLTHQAASSVIGTISKDFHQYSFSEFERDTLIYVESYFLHQNTSSFY
jgi:protein required for attachment to host cells